MIALALALLLNPPPEPLRPTVGMSAAEVRERWGPPRRVARQVIYKRCLEQWVYDAPHFFRVDFDAVQGKHSQVQSVRSTNPERP